MIRKRLVYWVVGTIIAFTGVAMVRLFPPHVPEERFIITILAGFSLSILGLFIITLGTRRSSSE